VGSSDRPRARKSLAVSDPDDPPNPPPRSSERPQLKAALAFAAVYLIWGSTYLAIRVGVRSIPPFLMSGCRFVGAGGMLYALLRLRGTPAPSRGEWARASIAGGLMLTMGNGLVTWAERRVPSNLAALIVAAVPLYMALLDWARPGGTPPARRVLIGIGIGACGMALLVSGDRGSSSGISMVGVGAILVSGLAWSAGSLYARHARMHRHPVMAAAQQMLAGGAAMLAIASLRGEPAVIARASPTAEGALALAYLTLFGSLVAFSAFGWLVKATSTARLSTIAYVNPVVAVILGWAILDEHLETRAITGAVLILAAVIAMTAQVPARRTGGALTRGRA
jgi:drug/metabolite transporter (DMT)-like permease